LRVVRSFNGQPIKAAEVPGTEPDLGFEEEGAELAVVAVEGGGGEGFVGVLPW